MPTVKVTARWETTEEVEFSDEEFELLDTDRLYNGDYVAEVLDNHTSETASLVDWDYTIR